ncbi:unnamed protein product [Boreogadus saida]
MGKEGISNPTMTQEQWLPTFLWAEAQQQNQGRHRSQGRNQGLVQSDLDGTAFLHFIFSPRKGIVLGV